MLEGVVDGEGGEAELEAAEGGLAIEADDPEGVDEGDAATCEMLEMSAICSCPHACIELHILCTGRGSSASRTRRSVRKDVFLRAIDAEAPRLMIARSRVVALPNDVSWRVVGTAGERVSPRGEKTKAGRRTRADALPPAQAGKSCFQPRKRQDRQAAEAREPCSIRRQ